MFKIISTWLQFSVIRSFFKDQVSHSKTTKNQYITHLVSEDEADAVVLDTISRYGLDRAFHVVSPDCIDLALESPLDHPIHSFFDDQDKASDLVLIIDHRFIKDPDRSTFNDLYDMPPRYKGHRLHERVVVMTLIDDSFIQQHRVSGDVVRRIFPHIVSTETTQSKNYSLEVISPEDIHQNRDCVVVDFHGTSEWEVLLKGYIDENDEIVPGALQKAKDQQRHIIVLKNAPLEDPTLKRLLLSFQVSSEKIGLDLPHTRDYFPRFKFQSCFGYSEKERRSIIEAIPLSSPKEHDTVLILNKEIVDSFGDINRIPPQCHIHVRGYLSEYQWNKVLWTMKEMNSDRSHLHSLSWDHDGPPAHYNLGQSKHSITFKPSDYSVMDTYTVTVPINPSTQVSELFGIVAVTSFYNKECEFRPTKLAEILTHSSGAPLSIQFQGLETNSVCREHVSSLFLESPYVIINQDFIPLDPNQFHFFDNARFVPSKAVNVVKEEPQLFQSLESRLQARFGFVRSILLENRSVCIEGPTASGKSFMATVLRSKGHAVFTKTITASTTHDDLLGQFKLVNKTDGDSETVFVENTVLQWLKKKSPKSPLWSVLFLENYNLMPPDEWAALEPLFSKGELTINQTTYVMTSQQKIILVGNPSHSFPGRFEQPWVSRLVDKMTVSSFSGADMVSMIMAPAFRTLNYSREDKVHALSIVPNQGVSPRDYHDKSSFIHAIATQYNHLQLAHIVSWVFNVGRVSSQFDILEDDYKRELESFRGFVKTKYRSFDTQSKVFHTVFRSIWTRDFIMTHGNGNEKKGVLLKGNPGLGKDFIVEAYYDYKKRPLRSVSCKVGTGFYSVLDSIKDSMRKGTALKLSEPNIYESHYLEGELNDRLDSYSERGFCLIATMNDSSLLGRERVSDSLLSRLDVVDIPSMTGKDLFQLLNPDCRPLIPQEETILRTCVFVHRSIEKKLMSRGYSLALTRQDFMSAVSRCVDSPSTPISRTLEDAYRLYLSVLGVTVDALLSTEDHTFRLSPDTVSQRSTPAHKVETPIQRDHQTPKSEQDVISVLEHDFVQQSDLKVEFVKPFLNHDELSLSTLRLQPISVSEDFLEVPIELQVDCFDVPVMRDDLIITMSSTDCLVFNISVELENHHWTPVYCMVPFSDIYASSLEDVLFGHCQKTGQLCVSLKPNASPGQKDLIYAAQLDDGMYNHFESFRSNHTTYIQDSLSYSFSDHSLPETIGSLFRNEEFRSSYELEFNGQSLFDLLESESVSLYKKVEGIQKFLKSFTPVSDSEGCSDFSTGDLVLDHVAHMILRKEGACRHRAKLFDYLAHYAGVKSFTMCNSLHAFSDVLLPHHEGNRIVRVDFGGTPVQLDVKINSKDVMPHRDSGEFDRDLFDIRLKRELGLRWDNRFLTEDFDANTLRTSNFIFSNVVRSLGTLAHWVNATHDPQFYDYFYYEVESYFQRHSVQEITDLMDQVISAPDEFFNQEFFEKTGNYFLVSCMQYGVKASPEFNFYTYLNVCARFREAGCISEDHFRLHVNQLIMHVKHHQLNNGVSFHSFTSTPLYIENPEQYASSLSMSTSYTNTPGPHFDAKRFKQGLPPYKVSSVSRSENQKIVVINGPQVAQLSSLQRQVLTNDFQGRIGFMTVAGVIPLNAYNHKTHDHMLLPVPVSDFPHEDILNPQYVFLKEHQLKTIYASLPMKVNRLLDYQMNGFRNSPSISFATELSQAIPPVKADRLSRYFKIQDLNLDTKVNLLTTLFKRYRDLDEKKILLGMLNDSIQDAVGRTFKNKEVTHDNVEALLHSFNIDLPEEIVDWIVFQSGEELDVLNGEMVEYTDSEDGHALEDDLYSQFLTKGTSLPGTPTSFADLKNVLEMIALGTMLDDFFEVLGNELFVASFSYTESKLLYGYFCKTYMRMEGKLDMMGVDKVLFYFAPFFQHSVYDPELGVLHYAYIAKKIKDDFNIQLQPINMPKLAEFDPHLYT